MNAKDVAVIALAALVLKNNCDLKAKEWQLHKCERELKMNECVYTPYDRYHTPYHGCYKPHYRCKR